MGRNDKSGGVSLVVMNNFCLVPGAPIACADFCDPTAVCRLKVNVKLG